MKRNACLLVIDDRINRHGRLLTELTKLVGGIAVSGGLLVAADPVAAKVFMTFMAGASSSMAVPTSFPKTWQVQPGQTLHMIAARLAPTGGKATRAQIEQALFKANPHAFMEGKPDRLRQDVALSIPDEIATLAKESKTMPAVVAHSTAASLAGSAAGLAVATSAADAAEVPSQGHLTLGALANALPSSTSVVLAMSPSQVAVPSAATVAATHSQEEGTRIPIGVDHAMLGATSAAAATTGLASAQVPWNFSDDWTLIKKKWHAWLDNPLSLRLLGAVAAGLLVLLLLILLGGLAHWRASRAKIAEINPAVEPILAHQADTIVQHDDDEKIAKMPAAMAALDLTLPDLPEEPAPSAASPSSPQNKSAPTKAVHHRVTHSKTAPPEVVPSEAAHPKTTHNKTTHPKTVHHRAAPKAVDSVQTVPSSSTSGASEGTSTGVAGLSADTMATQDQQYGTSAELSAGATTNENPSLAMAREYIALGTATQTRARALLEDLLSSNDPATRAAAQALLDISRAI